MPFAVAAGIGAVGAIAGAEISASGARKAAQDQKDATENATQAQLQMFNTTQGDYANQIKLGAGASNLLATLYGTNGRGTPNYAAFDNSPGYKFSLQQGENAINRQAAANGNLYSSNTLGALSAYNTGAASTQYNSYINQLLSMAGLGNAAASGVGNAATATGGEIGANMNLGGSAAAAGAVGQANAFKNAFSSSTGGLSGLLSNYLTNPNAGGQYGGEFAPGVSTDVTYNPDYSSVYSQLGVD